MTHRAIKDPVGKKYAKALNRFIKAKEHILNHENPLYYNRVLGRSWKEINEMLRAMNNQSRIFWTKLACHKVLRESDIKLVDDWMAMYQYSSFI